MPGYGGICNKGRVMKAAISGGLTVAFCSRREGIVSVPPSLVHVGLDILVSPYSMRFDCALDSPGYTYRQSPVLSDGPMKCPTSVPGRPCSRLCSATSSCHRSMTAGLCASKASRDGEVTWPKQLGDDTPLPRVAVAPRLDYPRAWMPCRAHALAQHLTRGLPDLSGGGAAAHPVFFS